MSLPKPLDDALARLNRALHRLQAAVDQRAQADAARGDRDRELALLQEDRGRLAGELDESLMRQARLRGAQDEVVRRLEGAGRAVQTALQQLPAARAQDDAA